MKEYNFKSKQLFFIYFIMIGFRYRRVRKSPLLTVQNKLERLLWCLRSKKKDFRNFLFADETAIWLRDIPTYHLREPTKYPTGIPARTKYGPKFNICGAISFKGITRFAVKI